METHDHLHREDLLEAEIRLWRQRLRNLANAVIAGDEDLTAMAEAALLRLDEV
jgi:hypothetical protein